MNDQGDHRKLWIWGKWIDSADRAEIVDPYTRRSIGTVALANERLIDEALAAAQGAFEVTRRLAPFERAALLAAAAEGIRRRAAEFADTIVAEAGKPIVLAEVEVERAVTTFMAASEQARSFCGELINIDAFPAGRGHFGLVRRFPVGVVYGITPFNFPLNLVAHKVAPALAVGNSIVIKPSPRAPLSALLLAEALHDAGVPEGAYNVIVTSNELASRPVRDRRVRHVSFTGSVPVGWSIKQMAADKRVTLELGGNAGVIVHEDANLQAAVPAIASGAFAYAGQSCISVQRVFVHASVYDDFRDRFIRHVLDHVRVGNPRDRSTLLGPLIDDAAVARVAALLEQAIQSGARVLCGGKFSGACLHPTVLDSVDPKHDVCATEAFAPIVTLSAYETFEQAISRVNDSVYGLQAGVFTRDLERALAAFEQLEVGGVMINQVPTFRVEHMPYGGMKASGFGREGVRWAMQEMSEPKTLVVNRGT